MKKFIAGVNHALDGIVHAFKTQRNMRIHVIIAILVVIAALITYVTRFEMMALSITIAFVFITEMINTAVESVVDLITKEYRPLAKVAKNVAAGAVLIAALNAVVVGYLIFYRKIYDLSFVSLNYLTHLPSHIIFSCLVVVGLIVIIIKSRSIKKHGTYVQGGMPSGHTALAFSLFTSIALVGQDPVVTSFSAIMAVIVAESRLETNVHTFKEVAFGALLGILITVIIFQLANWLTLTPTA